PGRVLVCTVATEAGPGLASLRESCARFGIELSVFGMGRPWKGFGWRQRTLYWNLVRRCWRYTHVLFVDGYDTVLASPLDEVLHRYEALRTPLLFGAEIVSHPVPAEAYPAATAAHRYRYLNAGAFIGDLRHVVRVMTALRVFSLRDDFYDQEL